MKTTMPTMMNDKLKDTAHVTKLWSNVTEISANGEGQNRDTKQEEFYKTIKAEKIYNKH